jgi:hypothetical protein
VRIKKMGAALALGGALAVSGLAIAGPANAATTATATAKPAAWIDTGMDFEWQGQCTSYGSWMVATDQANAYSCDPLDPNATWTYYELYIYLS